MGEFLKENVRWLCTDFRATLVLNKALQIAAAHDRIALGEAVVSCQEVLEALAQQCHAKKVISALLKVPSNVVREKLLHLQEAVPCLERTRYGRQVKKLLDSSSRRCSH